MKYTFALLFLFVACHGFSQCKTFMIGVHGDTLDCTDNGGLKQGKWVIHTPDLRGEKGFEEEGVFNNSKREGTWRTYSLQGDLLALENYKWGYKNGISQYYNVAGLIRQESWKAVNPEYPYDTVDVYDLKDPNKVTQQIVKVEGTSYRNGTWTYYDPSNGAIYKTETYVLDKLQTPLNKGAIAKGTTGSDTATTAKKVDKPAEVLQYEKKNSNKKKIKVRDGATGY